MLSEECLTGTAAVIGAGTMGRGIAAQLANTGWQVHLLDTAPGIAREGLERLLHSSPTLLFLPEFALRIHPGSVSDSLGILHTADWVVEAVFEDTATKQAIMAELESCVGPETLVSSNTSGLSLHEMTRDRSLAFRRRFLGSHFLNPPRYLKLLEVIPLPETDPERLDGFIRFAEQVLGHRVVQARDTPGFISTRIGIWHLLDSLHTALEMGLTPEEADAVTGPLLGRPRTGTFRLADMIGLDIVAAIGRDLYARLSDDPKRDRFEVPDIVERLLAAGRAGDKSGAGFYKRADGQSLTLDMDTLEYRPRRDVSAPGLEGLLRLPLRERLPLLDRQDVPGGRFACHILQNLGGYLHAVGPRIADDVQAIDHALQWGFGWEIGPSEIDRVLNGNSVITKYQSKEAPEYRPVADYKRERGTLADAPEASLIDLGSGAACLEFHTKMNTFSPALSAFLDEARERAERDFRALVIASDAPNFSAGYDLHLFLQAAEMEDWPGLDSMLHQIQSAFRGLRDARVPVVAAPRGYTLGAGCECVLHCAAAVAAPELTLGLPEFTVGVIPAGGGTTRLLARAMKGAVPGADPFPAVEGIFELLTRPRNSANAYDARLRGLLRPSDPITPNADRQLYTAQRLALSLAQPHYHPPEPKAIPVGGEEMRTRLRIRIEALHTAGQMTDHDRLIAEKIAFVLCGGALSSAQEVSEAYLHELERQVFLELMHEPKTLARMRHVLETGKPLRN